MEIVYKKDMRMELDAAINLAESEGSTIDCIKLTWREFQYLREQNVAKVLINPSGIGRLWSKYRGVELIER